MQTNSLLIYSFVLFSLFVSACTTVTPPIDEENVPVEPPDTKPAVDFSTADIDALELQIFEAVNAERVKGSVRPLIWDARVNAVARAHSQEISETFVKHQSESGASFYDRIKDAGIIYITAGENIYKSGTLNADSNLTTATIDGWLTSPGHKSILLDLDNLYSHGAVGVACQPTECFVTFNVIGAEQRRDMRLSSGYGTFITLYNPVWDYGDNITINIDMTASLGIEVQVVKSEDDWDNYLKRNYQSVKSIYKGNRVETLEKTFVVEKGYGIILFNNNFPGSTVDLIVDYAG